MTVPVRQKTLEEILVRRGWLYPERATAQAQEAKRIRHPLRQHLLKERVLLEERLAEATAEQFGLRFDPLTEFLDLSDRIKEMILDRRPTSELRSVAMAEGLTTLRDAAIEKVVHGETTIKEINR